MPSDFQQWLNSPEGQAAMGGVADTGPKPLGPHVSARMPLPSTQSRPIITAADPAQRQTTTYLEGDEWSRFVGLAPEMVSGWQRKMVHAGLLQGTFRAGRWDGPTAKAMGDAMSYGNAWGTDYGTAIDRLATSPERDTEAAGQMPPRNQFIQPAYQEPTSEMLAQEVKGFVRDRLGREPDDVDMSTLSSALARIHRRDYEEQVAMDRSEFGRQEDARMAEAEAALAGEAEAGGVGAPGEFEATGPDAVAAEFAEEFERLYEDETGFVRRREQGTEGEQSFFGSLMAVDRAIGG